MTDVWLYGTGLAHQATATAGTCHDILYQKKKLFSKVLG